MESSFPIESHSSGKRQKMIPNNNFPDKNRRSAFKSLLAVPAAILSSSTITTTTANALTNDDDSISSSFLSARVLDRDYSPVKYGMDAVNKDIYYPEYFEGVWNVRSTCTNVEAPCGIMLFGGNSTYFNALNDIGEEKALTYRARFITTTSENKIIADREFNVKEIAKAAMGSSAVMDMPTVTPNKLCCVLNPTGGNNVFTVDMITVARKQEPAREAAAIMKSFDCSEYVRQIVSVPSTSQLKSSQRKSIKEIETICLYNAVSSSELIVKQRTATYLIPQEDDPMSVRAWSMTKGQPIDVRYYDVVYKRKK